jgi:4-hydroxy-3-methylbut-2-en-1-yl diphosphate reductase
MAGGGLVQGPEGVGVRVGGRRNGRFPARAPKRGFEVLRAREMGMCFGVRDALVMARGVQTPVDFTVFGELVHNPAVTRSLEGRGFHLMGEMGRAGEVESAGVLITAHGVSDAQRRAFEKAGKRVVDTTCPLVRRAHAAALTLAGEGRHVVVVGKAGHVEVTGLTGDLASFDVVAGVEGVRAYGFEKLGVVAQTTTTDAVFDAVAARVRELNPRADVKAVRTVCQPTRDRQEAVRELVEKVDALVVVGGENSNNSRMLCEVGKKAGKGALLVSGVEGLSEERVWGMLPSGKERCVLGLTAGTSALDETVNEVEVFLRGLGKSGGR